MRIAVKVSLLSSNGERASDPDRRYFSWQLPGEAADGASPSRSGRAVAVTETSVTLTGCLRSRSEDDPFCLALVDESGSACAAEEGVNGAEQGLLIALG